MAKALILTHILQTEVKNKMSALKKGLQREPAFPDGSPARRTIMGACQIAPQACHLYPEGAHRHAERRPARALGQHGQHQRLHHLVSRALWVFPSAGTHLQQAYGQRGQQTQQAYQAINRLQLPLLNATPTFKALMIVLNQPPLSIPLDPLPGLFERRGGDRGQQDPFQRLLAFWSFLFPHTNDPHGQGLLARSWLLARWQERHLPKGQLELCTPLLMTMPSGKLQHTARLEEGEHIRPPISDMHPQASRLRGANGLHLAHPDSGFALLSFAPLRALFSLGSGNAHKRLPSPGIPAPLGSEDAPPAPFARKIPI